MNFYDFDCLAEDVYYRSFRVLTEKAKEYAIGEDRLAAFKDAADVLKTTPYRALLGMWMKHVQSLVDIVNRTQQRSYPTRAMLDEKILDAINYLILLRALFEEHFTGEDLNE